MKPGQRIAYSDVRAHLDHVKEAIEEAAARCLMLEIIQDGKPWTMAKKFPENKLAEALGL